MTDPALIAAALSPAQRKALLSVCTTHFRPLSREASKALGADLRWRLLMQSGSDYTLNETGEQVRAMIAAAERGER